MFFNKLSALFTTGAILNPAVWIGIILGAFLYSNSMAYDVLTSYYFYILSSGLFGVYLFLFRCPYKLNGDFDLTTFILKILGLVFRLTISAVCGIAFLMFVLNPV